MTLKARLQDRLPLARLAANEPLTVERIDALEAECKAFVYAHADEMKKEYQELPIDSLRVLAMAGHRSYFDGARALLLKRPADE